MLGASDSLEAPASVPALIATGSFRYGLDSAYRNGICRTITVHRRHGAPARPRCRGTPRRIGPRVETRIDRVVRRGHCVGIHRH